MATIDEALVAAILAQSTLSALIGTRFLPEGGGQQKTYPYATYQRITTPTARHLTGSGSLEWPLFQVNIWAKSYSSAQTVADAFRNFLDPADNAVEIVGGGKSFAPELQDQRGPALDEETQNFGCSLDFQLTHVRS